jgi:ribonucleoside-diphosphate reductase alpha chain
MKGFDAFAGVIKSGGKTRRAAKMVILNVDHPDIEEFVECKAKEEKKAHALIKAGYDSSIDGDAYGSIFFQNANNSVRVSDDFMRAVLEDREWETKAVTSGAVVPGSAATQVCSTTPLLTAGTLQLTAGASTVPIRAASTCSWTTPPATWRP